MTGRWLYQMLIGDGIFVIHSTVRQPCNIYRKYAHQTLKLKNDVLRFRTGIYHFNDDFTAFFVSHSTCEEAVLPLLTGNNMVVHCQCQYVRAPVV